MARRGAAQFSRWWSHWARSAAPSATAVGSVAAAAALATRGDARGGAHCHIAGERPHSHTVVGGAEPRKTGHPWESPMIMAVPKKGRIYEQVCRLLDGAGVEYKRKDRLDIAHCKNLPMTIVFLPAKDISIYVAQGSVDLGITGEDTIAESEMSVDVLLKLGFGKCNLSVQAPVTAEGLPDVKTLAGKRIVTSFPNLAKSYFKELEEAGAPTQIAYVSGSVEAACGLGLADAIVDLVETGTTMRAAGLGEVALVMKSEVVLIKNPHSMHNELIELLLQRIKGYQTAQSWVMLTYNVPRASLPVVETITPGKRSPTVTPLEDKNWVAVQALVPKVRMSAIMDELAENGATDILANSLLTTRMI